MKLFYTLVVVAYISFEIVLSTKDVPRDKRQLFYSDIQNKPKTFRSRASEKSEGSKPEEDLTPVLTTAGVPPPSFNRRPSSNSKPTSSFDESFINNPKFEVSPQKPRPSFESRPHKPSLQIRNPLLSIDEPRPYGTKPVHNQPEVPYEDQHKNSHKRPKPFNKRPNSKYPTSIRKAKRPVFGQRRKPIRNQITRHRLQQNRPKPEVQKPTYKPTPEHGKPTAYINQSNSPKLSVHKTPQKARPRPPYRPNADVSEFGEQPIANPTHINFQNPKIYEELQHIPSGPSYKPKSSFSVHKNKPSYDVDPHLGLTSSAVYEQDPLHSNQLKGDPGYQAPHSYRAPHKPKPAYEEPYKVRLSGQSNRLLPKASSYIPHTSGDHSQQPKRLRYKEKKNPIPGVPGKDYPTYHQVPYTSFTCKDVPTRPGMYANPETGCQAYHVCHDDRHGDQGASFLCTNGTVFNQETFSCDWWYNVDCSKAKSFYGLNSDPAFNPYYKKPYEEQETYKHAASNFQQKPSVSSYNPRPQPSYRHHSAPFLSQGTTTNTFTLPGPSRQRIRPQITRPFENARVKRLRQIIRKAAPLSSQLPRQVASQSVLPQEQNYEFKHNFQTVKSFLRKFEDESKSTNVKGNDERVVLGQPQQKQATNTGSETLNALKRIMRRRKQPSEPQPSLKVVAQQEIPEMIVEEIPEGAVVDLEWGQRSA